MRSIRFWLPAGVILILACGRTEKSSCRKDTDCKGDRICEMGACVEPRLRPVSKDEEDAQAPDPDPDPPPLPSVPRIPQIPSLPSLSVPGFNISGGALNLKFDLQVGGQTHTIELVPGGSSGPNLRWCVDKKCEVLDPSSPKDLEKLFDRFAATAGASDPKVRETLQMLKDLSGLLNASGGFGGISGGGFGGAPFVNTPTGPNHAGVFHTCEEILEAGNRAEGAQADVEELVPTIVSSDQVTFKAPGGILVELQVPFRLQGMMPALARTQQGVSVRFRILRAAGKYIRGELQQVQVQ